MPEQNNRAIFEVEDEDTKLIKQYKGIDVSYNKGANPCFVIPKYQEE